MANYYTMKTINYIPEYIKFSTAPFIQELRKLIFSGKNEIINEVKTRNGDFIFLWDCSEEKLVKINDLTSDVLNCLIALLGLKSDSLICVDDVIFMRNKLAGKNQKGSRGGYSKPQRKEIIEQLELLSYLKIDVSNIRMAMLNEDDKRVFDFYKAEDYLFSIQKTAADNYLIIEPGNLLEKTINGIGSKSGIINKKVLEYDYYRHYFEKRLGNYLSYIWRIRQNKAEYLKPLSVKNIIDKIGINLENKRPTAFRLRFEEALDKLEEDGVISVWQYAKINEDILIGRNWFDIWLNLNLIIEPPSEVIEEYLKIKKFGRTKPLAFDYKLILERINDKNLTQLFISEKTGIIQDTLSKILSGRTHPTLYERRKILKLLTLSD